MKKYVRYLLIMVVLLGFTETSLADNDHHKFVVEMKEGASVETLLSYFSTIEIIEQYDTLFSGFAARGSNEDIQRLKEAKEVANVYRVSSYRIALDDSVEFIGGEHIRKKAGELEEVKGRGVKVGIIDTGIDYTHPDLRDAYKGGYDLVDNDDDPMETTVKQGIPTNHGTHVAGIVAANGRMKGVAPEAELYAYRALGPGGTGTSDQVIAAIEKAVEDGMDVINLSLGNEVNGPDWPTSIALDKAVERGVIAVTSSGNSGPAVWTVGSPGTSDKAISVGASSPPLQLPSIKLFTQREPIPIRLLQGSPAWSITKSYEVVFAEKGRKEDFIKMNGKIALVERGDIPFTEKVMNAQEAGAAAVLIYNHEKGGFEGMIEGEVSIPAASLTRKEGHALKKDIRKGHSYLKLVTMTSKDQVAPFSSRGPVTIDWGIKPDLTAPGVAIDSTVPNGYEAMNGTSMAAPHVTGAVALMKEKHPNWTPEQVKSALMNTAKTMYNDKQPYEVYEQGAGRIQLDRALTTETLIYPASFSLGYFEQKLNRNKKTVLLTIENTGSASKKYSFRALNKERGAQWSLPSPFTLPASGSKQVEIEFDVQPEFLQMGMQGGYLEVHDGTQALTLPYLYVVEDDSYHKIMGFNFGYDEQKQNYQYELYLPEDAQSLTIMIFDPDTLRLVTTIHEEEKVRRGRKHGSYIREELPVNDGLYKIVALIESDGKVHKQEVYGWIGNQNKNTGILLE